jgi:striatin 1/3/4
MYKHSFLFRYLQEVGYTDTILDVRSSRVRSILGLSSVNVPEVPPAQMNGTSPRKPDDGPEFEDEMSQHSEPVHVRQQIQGGHEIVNPTPRRYVKGISYIHYF